MPTRNVSDLDLLNGDQCRLLVVPCTKSFEVDERLRLYYCPKARTLRKAAKYLGVYAQMRVRAIGQISKIVAPEIEVARDTVAIANGEAILTHEETADSRSRQGST